MRAAIKSKKYIFELRLEGIFRRKGILSRRNSICKDTKEYGIVKGMQFRTTSDRERKRETG